MVTMEREVERNGSLDFDTENVCEMLLKIYNMKTHCT